MSRESREWYLDPNLILFLYLSVYIYLITYIDLIYVSFSNYPPRNLCLTLRIRTIGKSP